MVVAAEQSDREVEAFTCIIPTYLGSQIQAFESMTSSTKSQATTKHSTLFDIIQDYGLARLSSGLK
jgi:hypothetical protein